MLLLFSHFSLWATGGAIFFYYLFFLSSFGVLIKKTLEYKGLFYKVGCLFFVFQVLSTLVALFYIDIPMDRLVAIFRNYVIFLLILSSSAYISDGRLVPFLRKNVFKYILLLFLIGLVVYSWSLLNESNAYLDVVFLKANFSYIRHDFGLVLPRLALLSPYPNAFGLFVFLLMYLYFSLRPTDSCRRKVLIWMLCLLMIAFSGSRIVFICAAFSLPFVFSVQKNFIKLLFFLIFLSLLIFSYYLYGVAELLYASRLDSSLTRIGLYVDSMKIMLSESALLGYGHKPYIGDYNIPLGSHSTIIGYFFKNGIIGGLVALVMFFAIALRAFFVISLRKVESSQAYASVGVLFILVISLFEDVDAVELNAILIGFIFSFFLSPSRDRLELYRMRGGYVEK